MMNKVRIKQMNGFNFLWIDDYLWMWDTLPEQRAQKAIAEQAHGNVLVAGYGLGLVQKYLLENGHVCSVVTAELYREVMEANLERCGEQYGAVLIKDFFEFPEDITMKYDCIIGDVWEDILPEGLANYKLFKEKASKLLNPDGKILAWGQDYFEYLIAKEGGKGR